MRCLITTKSIVHRDLQGQSHGARLTEPDIYLEQLEGALVVLDEIQRAPASFPVLSCGPDVDGPDRRACGGVDPRDAFTEHPRQAPYRRMGAHVPKGVE